MTDPLAHIRHLAQVIGARGSTSSGEGEAQEYVARCLEGFGFDVSREAFRAPATYGWIYSGIGAVALAGFAAGRWLPTLGFLLAALAAVAFVGENTSQLLLGSALARRRPSQNVAGRLYTPGLPRNRLVLVAHADSARSGWMFAPGVVRWLRGTFVVTLFSHCALAMLLLLSAEPTLHRYAWVAAGIPAAVVLASVLGLVLRELTARVVAGANDNASGLAVALTLAEEFAGLHLRETEVWVVATGCEESGLYGMREFVRRHRGDLASAIIINIDNVGAGRIHCLVEEGMITTQAAAQELIDSARRVARADGLDVGETPYHVMQTDAVVALSAGLTCMTVMGLSDGRPVNWHWRTDVFENIDPDSVDTAFALVRGMALDLARVRGGAAGA
ncbi:MAG: M28 family metallopeptidase [Candidatus Dormibacteria bacterium]